MQSVASQLRSDVHPPTDEPTRTRQRELLAVRSAVTIVDWRLSLAITLGSGGLRVSLRADARPAQEQGSE